MLRRPEYLQCYSKGRRYFSRSFVVFVLAAAGDAPDGGDPATGEAENATGHRLGVGISRKAGNAVLRNRFKRLVREFYRVQSDALLDDVDVVVVPKKGLDIRRLTLSTVTGELVPLLQRARRELSPNATASAVHGGGSPGE